MAFNPAPNAWLDNWAEDGTEITIPIASFPELTAVEADGATGDIRKVIYALMEKLYAEYAERAVADRPGKMIITKSSALNPATGEITASYGVTLYITPASLDVSAES